MNFIYSIRKRIGFKFFSFWFKRECFSNNKGVIPIIIVVIIGFVSLLGAGIIGFFLGKGYSFSIGMAIGIGLVIILPNLDRIIKWFKSVKRSVKEENQNE